MVAKEKIFHLKKDYTLSDLSQAYLKHLEEYIRRMKANKWKEMLMLAKLFQKINDAFLYLYKQKEAEELAVNERTKAAEVLSKKARALYYKGDYWGAAEAFQQAISLDASRHTYFGFLGLCFLKLERYDSAIKSFERAIELFPASADYWYNLGLTYFKAGVNRKAVDKLTAAFLIEPKDERVLKILRILVPEAFEEKEGLLDKIKKFLIGG